MSARSKRESKPTVKYLNYCGEAGLTPTKRAQIKTSLANEAACKATNSQIPKASRVAKSGAKVSPKEGAQPNLTTKKQAAKPEGTTSLKRKKDAIENPSLTRNVKRRSGRQPKPTQKLMEFFHAPSAQEEALSNSSSDAQSCSSSGIPDVQLSHKEDENDGETAFGILESTEPVVSKEVVRQEKKNFVVTKKKVVVSKSLGQIPLSKPKLKVTKSLSIPLKDVTTLKAQTSSLPSKLAKLRKAEPIPTKIRKGIQTSAKSRKSISTAFRPQRSVSVTSVFQMPTKVLARSTATTTKGRRTLNVKTTSHKEFQTESTRKAPSSAPPNLPLHVQKSLHIPLDSIKVEVETEGTILVTPAQEKTSDTTKEMRLTLKKFLFMGTKVAHSISDSLNHNEESLLSTSSAFEKKCVSLVHAIAQHGRDLEAEDMENILNLLDEEQEERRAYRHCLLESLKVSHLTNMALYSQMLKLLKSL